MRGSTRKRGKTWTAYYDGPADPETGKRVQRSKGGFPTQKAAQRYLQETLPKVGNGIFVEPSKQPLARFLLDEWLPGVKGTIGPLSHARYESAIRTHIVTRDIGATPLKDITAGHLNALQVQLERCADPTCKHGQPGECVGLAPTSRLMIHAVLRHALNDAVDWDKLARNPAAKATKPKPPRTKVTAWTPRELRRFLDHVRDDRLYTLWRLAAMTGMRRGELLGLPLLCLDLEGGRLRVEQQIVPHPAVCPHCGERHSCSFYVPKRERSERTVALDAETVAVLRRHIDTQRLERDLAGPAYVDHDLVFCNELGGPILPHKLSAQFLAHRKAAGLTVGTLHVLRHTHATLALTATPPVPLHVVAARLGDNETTVLQTYSHLLPRSDQEAADIVAATIVDKPLTAAPLAGSGYRD